MDKEGLINIHNGKNRENLYVEFIEKTGGEKIWKVKIIIEHLSSSEERAIQYLLDGNTGKILKKDKFIINSVE
ncbi:hypothetical protein [Pedobacter sp. NJ-S-72]